MSEATRRSGRRFSALSIFIRICFTSVVLVACGVVAQSLWWCWSQSPLDTSLPAEAAILVLTIAPIALLIPVVWMVPDADEGDVRGWF